MERIAFSHAYMTLYRSYTNWCVSASNASLNDVMHEAYVYFMTISLCQTQY